MNKVIKYLSDEQVDMLFPYYMLIDNNMIISSYGKSLKKIAPEILKQSIFDVFGVKRSKLIDHSFEELKSKSKQLLILESKNDPKFILRGEIEYLQEADQLLFLGTLWLVSPEELTKLGLTLNDFAIHDQLPDMLMMLKTHQNANEDIKNLLSQVNQQKEELLKLSSIISSYSHPVVLCNDEYNITWVNDAFTRENGYTLEEVKNQHPGKFLYENHSNKSLSLEIDAKFYSGINFNNELINKSKSNKLFWVLLQGQCIYDKNNRQVLYFFIQQNIEKQKQAEKNIESALLKEKKLSEMKSSFVTMASHEFRTPMTIIKAHAELISMYLTKMPDENQDYILRHLETIDGEIERLNLLINDILMVSKIEQNQLNLSVESVLVSELIQQVIDRQYNCNINEGKIEFNIYGFERTILIDGIKINHIVDNLLSNALKYSKGKKAPVISLYYLPKNILIKIKDFGIGIPLAEQTSIFNTFYRASNATNLKGKGIGLSLVKNFVELHGGHIHFSSTENVGTEFSVSIPYKFDRENELV